MKRKLLIGTIWLGLVLRGSRGDAAENPKYQIEVLNKAQADDSVGGRLVYAVKEEIRKSKAYELTIEPKTGLKLLLQTMPLPETEPTTNGLATMYLVVWYVWLPCGKEQSQTYLDSRLGYAGKDATETTARDIMVNTDQLVEKLERRAASKN